MAIEMSKIMKQAGDGGPKIPNNNNNTHLGGLGGNPIGNTHVGSNRDYNNNNNNNYNNNPNNNRN